VFGIFAGIHRDRGITMKKTVLGAVTFLVGSRPCTTGLAAAIAGIVAWSLVTAPLPDGAARTEPRVAQLESQVVQLEALILRSATTLEESLSTRVPSDRAVTAADITAAAVSTAGTVVSHLKAAGSPTPTTGSSTSPSTAPATTIQHTANAALATTQGPIIKAILFVEDIIFVGFLLIGTAITYIADLLGFCLFSCPPRVVAPAAASAAAVSPVETKPVVNKVVRLITTTVNTVKARIGAAAPTPRTVAPKRTVSPKPLSVAVNGAPVAGKPQVSRNEPTAHPGPLRTAVRSMTSKPSHAVKHATGITKKAQN
jgi:hypothetical protein